MQEHWIKEGQGFVLVYSIVDNESFEEITSFLSRIRRVCKRTNMPIMVVGNKVDLEPQRKVQHEAVQELCAKNNLLHIECSAKTGFRCKEVFT